MEDYVIGSKIKYIDTAGIERFDVKFYSTAVNIGLEISMHIQTLIGKGYKVISCTIGMDSELWMNSLTVKNSMKNYILIYKLDLTHTEGYVDIITDYFEHGKDLHEKANEVLVKNADTATIILSGHITHSYSYTAFETVTAYKPVKN